MDSNYEDFVCQSGISIDYDQNVFLFDTSCDSDSSYDDEFPQVTNHDDDVTQVFDAPRVNLRSSNSKKKQTQQSKHYCSYQNCEYSFLKAEALKAHLERHEGK